VDRPRTLAEIEAAVTETAARIQPTEYYLPTYGRSEGFGRPHVETSARDMSYVIVERGTELQRHTTTDLDMLLYWIFRDVTFSMAVDYEVAHRSEGQDFRILLFQHQLQLLQDLRPEWRHRYATEKADQLAELGMAQHFGWTG
jgi:hypothetical protein